MWKILKFVLTIIIIIIIFNGGKTSPRVRCALVNALQLHTLSFLNHKRVDLYSIYYPDLIVLDIAVTGCYLWVNETACRKYKRCNLMLLPNYLTTIFSQKQKQNKTKLPNNINRVWKTSGLVGDLLKVVFVWSWAF